MTGVWLDNPKYPPPQPSPFDNSGAIQGISTYIGGDAVYAASTPYAIVNGGALTAAGSGNGIDLRAGGSVTNGVGGTVAGAGFGSGIFIAPGGSVVNSGTVTGFFAVDIDGGGGLVQNNGQITAAGVNSEGVRLGTSGTVVNGFANANAVISGAFGVVVNTGGQVSNYATIIGTVAGTAGAGFGVEMTTGGAVINGGAVDLSALISGGFEGVDIEGTGGNLTNYGTVTGTYAVVARPGSVVSNKSGASVVGSSDGIFLGANGYPASGAGQIFNSGFVQATNGATLGNGIVLNTKTAFVTNNGTVVGTGSGGAQSSTGLGIAFNYGGYLYNGPTASIQGYAAGVSAGKGVLTVINNGSISGAITGIRVLSTAGTVTNVGTIVANTGSYGVGVFLKDGGYVLNKSNRYIGGSIVGVDVATVAGTVVNYGRIAGAGVNQVLAAGVLLSAGGNIVNYNGSGGPGNYKYGVIVGVGAGVDVKGAAATVTNKGSISATGSVGVGVKIEAGGSLVNYGGITGASVGVDASGSAAAVTNKGSISATGTAGIGIKLEAGGSIANTANITGVIDAIDATGTAATVTNNGSISITASSGFGVRLEAGGIVLNSGGVNLASATGYDRGIDAAGAPATITNYGSILVLSSGIGIDLEAGGEVENFGSIVENRGTPSLGATSTGVRLDASGLVVNNDAGYIYGAGSGLYLAAGGSATNSGIIFGGNRGIGLAGGGATITNSGVIEAVFRGPGIQINASAAVSISNFGTIAGYSGILSIGAAGPTIMNRGMIIASGTFGRAISLGDADGRLIETPGAVIAGGISGGGGVLELAGGSPSTLAGFGSTITNFSTLQFDSGANWTVEGSAAGFPGTITGFAIGNTIDVDGFVAVSRTFANNTLVLTDTANNEVTLGIQGNFSTDGFGITGDGRGGTDVTTTACYCRGTTIATERGEVPVEQLAIGDRVMTLSGALKAIKWIGRRSYDGRFVAGNRAVLPIRIAAGAFADGVPVRDLWVSPEHALYIDGALVPARQLVNGASVAQAEAIAEVDYFHIELDVHDIIFAEGMPAESYVDCDNRGMFHNTGEFAPLYPDDRRPAWEFCVPRLGEGSAALPAIRGALLARAEALGYRLTDDPDLRLMIDGEIVRAHAVEDGVCRFTIPAGSRAVWLTSRSAVPAELAASSQDWRRLGVPLKTIVLREPGLCTEIGHGHPSLREGFHDDEDGHRWTDGIARLPDELLRPFAGEVALEVRLIRPGLRYPLEMPVPAAFAGAAACVGSARQGWGGRCWI